MYMKLNRSTYLIILLFLAILYFSYLKKTKNELKDGFTTNKKLETSCIKCQSECSPNYTDLCMSTVKSCLDCKNSKKEILPKSRISLERNKENNEDIYELSKKLNPEVLVINQLISTDNIVPNNGIMPSMTNIQISAHPNFDNLEFTPRNLITGMYTKTDPVPANSTLERKDVPEKKYTKL